MVHRDPALFGKDADFFKPDRWLHPDSKVLEKNLIAVDIVNLHRPHQGRTNASMQFGAGYMSCPGRHVAHMQLSKLLSTLFLDYDIELERPDQEWPISGSIIARPYGWSVKAKQRQLLRV